MIDTVINCTGTHPGFLQGLCSKRWVEIARRTIDLNLRPAFHLYRAFFDAFRTGGGGHFVHLSSVALNDHDPSEAGYCASKAALASLTKCAATAVCPPPRNTYETVAAWLK